MQSSSNSKVEAPFATLTEDRLLPSDSSAQVNPDAAEADVAAELLSEDGAPYCFDTQGEVLKCSTNADRTYRAGVHELAVRALHPGRVASMHSYPFFPSSLLTLSMLVCTLLCTGMGTHRQTIL